MDEESVAASEAVKEFRAIRDWLDRGRWLSHELENLRVRFEDGSRLNQDQPSGATDVTPSAYLEGCEARWAEWAAEAPQAIEAAFEVSFSPDVNRSLRS